MCLVNPNGNSLPEFLDFKLFGEDHFSSTQKNTLFNGPSPQEVRKSVDFALHEPMVSHLVFGKSQVGRFRFRVQGACQPRCLRLVEWLVYHRADRFETPQRNNGTGRNWEV